MTQLHYPILAVTGGRDVQPTPDELAAFGRACRRRHVRVVRFGDCPTGVDAAVQAWAESLRLGTEPGERAWVWEQWQAAWNRQGRKAGPMRNGAMLEGKPMRCAGVFCMGGNVSRGRARVLVAWPGGAGTANARAQAERLGIRIVQISELV